MRPDQPASTIIQEGDLPNEASAAADPQPEAGPDVVKDLTAEPAEPDEQVETLLGRARLEDTDEIRERLCQLEARLRRSGEHQALIDLLLGRVELSAVPFERARLLGEV